MADITQSCFEPGGLTAPFSADSVVWDNHTCTTLRRGNAESLTQLARHRAAGADVVCLNVGFDVAPAGDTIVLLAEFRRWLLANGDDYLLIEKATDVEFARASGRLGVCFNIEGGNSLLGCLSMVSVYYELGVRWMLFAYNRSNSLAGGCGDEDGGLTDFGREVMQEMERVGMVVCCSHVGHRSAMEIMDTASRPVIFSHSNPGAIWPHARNISDDAIRACARTGGVIGINGIGIFLGDNVATPELIVRHVDYVVDLVGPDHVGIGLDYAFDQSEADAFIKAHPETYPPDKYANGIQMVPPECLPRIAELLLARGYSSGDMRKIMGENHLRIARETWK